MRIKNKLVYGLILLLFILLNILSLTIYAARYSDVVYEKGNSEKKIALTFDDGPHPVHTPEILDILKEYNIKATFFVVGQNVTFHPELVKRAIAEGHEIGNHTFSHPHLANTDSGKIIEDIEKCEDAVYELCGYNVKLFRPPEGVLPEAIREYALSEEYTIILWSVDTYDWARAPVNDIISNIRRNISSGDIILMHDYVPKSITPTALKKIIPMLLEEGYQFVTVSELLESR